MKQRLAYLDNLKILLVVGVITVHAAITYGFDGSWYLESYDEMASGVVGVLTAILGVGWLFGLLGPHGARSRHRHLPGKRVLRAGHAEFSARRLRQGTK